MVYLTGNEELGIRDREIRNEEGGVINEGGGMGLIYGKVLHARSKKFCSTDKNGYLCHAEGHTRGANRLAPSFSREPAAKSWFQAQSRGIPS